MDNSLSLLVACERPSRDCLLLYRFWIRSCTIEHLEKVRRLGTHPGVYVGLGTLDVIVQVVTEDVNQVYCIVPCLTVRVPREEHKCDVANAVADTSIRVL